MSPSAPDSCPHERRPGTPVCLHCRHTERLARRARQTRTVTTVGGGAVALGVVLAIAVASAGKVHARLTGTLPASPRIARRNAPSPTLRVAFARTPAPAGATRASEAPTPGASSALIMPVLAEGTTALGDGLFAERSGAMVRVHFDTPAARTRRPEKFETVVRATLPQVYGAAADAILAEIPAGDLTHGSELLTDLPARGIHVVLPSGGTFALWPETRPGRDGPLVVSYRATVSP